MNVSCPLCGKVYRQKLDNSWLITCIHCQSKIWGEPNLPDHSFKLEEDFSLIEIGTKGIFKSNAFEIIGRARLQTKNDYRNLWCAHNNYKAFWICQGIDEPLSIFSSSFDNYPFGFYQPHADMFIEFTNNIKLKCILAEHCIQIKYEGEVPQFPFPNGNFLLVHAINAQGNTTLICYHNEHSIKFIWGELCQINSLSLDKIKQFNDWK